MLEDPGFDSGVRCQVCPEPREKVLVALARSGVGVEGGAHDVVGSVVDTEDEIAAGLIAEASLVGQGGKVLSDGVRVGVVPLELYPLGLAREHPESIHEGDELSGVHWRALLSC